MTHTSWTLETLPGYVAPRRVAASLKMRTARVLCVIARHEKVMCVLISFINIIALNTIHKQKTEIMQRQENKQYMADDECQHDVILDKKRINM